MTEQKIIVANRAGVHARPAALIVQKVKNFKCNIYISKENDRINAKSIMGVITLGAGFKTELTISAEGEDEVQAVQALAALFESKFEEE
ncbi:MAG: HPr family phosphocarrier protein [Treponema sp.]|jgi:phosphocarrier protein|nr:HPr family phosphocarrier protein [Treponema sp.]